MVGAYSDPHLGVCPFALSPGGFLVNPQRSPSQILSRPLCHLRHRDGSSPRIEHHERPEEGGVWDEVLWVPWPEVEERTGHSPLEELGASPSRWVSGPGSEPQPIPPLDDGTPAEREPSPGFSQGSRPGSLRTSGPSPHTSIGCKGESSPSREIGKTRKRLNQGCGHVGMGQPKTQGPNEAARSSQLLY